MQYYIGTVLILFGLGMYVLDRAVFPRSKKRDSLESYDGQIGI